MRGLLTPGFEIEARLIRQGEQMTVLLSENAPESAPRRFRRAAEFPLELPDDRGLMGVEFATPPSDPDDEAGIVLIGVAPDGPADRAGLRIGDRLISIRRDSVVPSSLADLWEQLRSDSRNRLREISDEYAYFSVARHIRPGDSATLSVLRHGTPLDAEVTFVSAEALPHYQRRPPLGL
jgi:S1-C subfamily serine protease